MASGPFFGLPRWLHRITLPPSATSFLMVGRAATMRLSLVMTPSFMGDVEVNTDQHPLAFYVNVVNSLFAEKSSCSVHSFKRRWWIVKVCTNYHITLYNRSGPFSSQKAVKFTIFLSWARKARRGGFCPGAGLDAAGESRALLRRLHALHHAYFFSACGASPGLPACRTGW